MALFSASFSCPGSGTRYLNGLRRRVVAGSDLLCVEEWLLLSVEGLVKLVCVPISYRVSTLCALLLCALPGVSYDFIEWPKY